MTRYTDCEGKHTILCDTCRESLIVGDSVFSLAPGKVSDGYISRDYQKGEIAICPACANQVTRMVALLSDISIRGNVARNLSLGREFNTTIQSTVPT